ncbi:MAG: NADH-quinone oxidoreductase subunit C [Sideroxydans sp.]|nr:NADH-quinone oxidoreductase subunit C [Sideroxydans sp.]
MSADLCDMHDKKLFALQENLASHFAGQIVSSTIELCELTLVVRAADLLQVFTQLRDTAGFCFEQMMDLCGMDYLDYGDGAWTGKRFAVVYHLMSVSLNQRLRVRVFAEEDAFPVLPSLTNVWSCANWFEREAFDLYGIVFTGHPDLRRLLTDYGFVGNPFRKDFPLSGHVEMKYDPSQQRVVYQPVSIEAREVTPRIVRDELYGSVRG